MPRLATLTFAIILATAISVALACAPTSEPTVGSDTRDLAPPPVDSDTSDLAPPSVGSDVGDLAPPFTMRLADASEVTSQNLAEAQRPALMLYFATW